MSRFTIAELIQCLPESVFTATGASTRSVGSLASRSSEATAGALFVAVRGTTSDGHAYVDDAFARGAVAAVVSDPSVLKGRPGIIVPETRSALSRLSALFAGNPSSHLKVVGITGTNGKTTTHWLTAHLLSALGEKTLRIGTLGSAFEGVFEREGTLTTPDPVALHSLLAEVLTLGCTAAVMESSSHALDQKRVEDIEYDVGIFTNLTRDHLDYHGDMESYFLAKRHLFELLTRGDKKGTAVVNSDDAYGRRIASWCSDHAVRLVTFGENADATLRIEGFSQSISGSSFRLSYRGETEEVRSPLIGRYNAENVVAAIGACLALGYSFRELCSKILDLPQAPGRLESVGQNGIGVYVDYSHTPDALENALAALREVVQNQLWVVFGCGGDRDRGKRPLMGHIAAAGADHVVVTSDNPRTEDPHAIISDILSEGVIAEVVEVDRRRAIAETLSRARPGDVVLIAGKGHENYQVIGTQKVHLSDVEEVERFFKGVK